MGEKTPASIGVWMGILLIDEYMKNPKNADKYIREIAKDFGCGKETVRVALKKLGYTRKKNRQNTGSRTRKK